MAEPAIEILSAGSKRELLDLLNELPSQLGFTRVYRGQTRRYLKGDSDTLLPALHRQSQKHYDPAWLAAAANAAFAVPDLSSQEMTDVWLPALLQHYGPGSFFLDVSAELDVAIWFALNKYCSGHVEIALQPGNVPVAVTIPFAHYERLERSQTDSPVIYVFDAPPWVGFGRPAHGDMVAVKDAPTGQSLLYRATRLDRQEAYLLYSDSGAISGPDLASLLRAVISLSPDFEWTPPAVFQKPTGLFPPPAEDACYARLWSVPLVACAPNQLNHPLDIVWFVSSARVAEIAARSNSGDCGIESIECDDLVGRLQVPRES